MSWRKKEKNNLLVEMIRIAVIYEKDIYLTWGPCERI